MTYGGHPVEVQRPLAFEAVAQGHEVADGGFEAREGGRLTRAAVSFYRITLAAGNVGVGEGGHASTADDPVRIKTLRVWPGGLVMEGAVQVMVCACPAGTVCAASRCRHGPGRQASGQTERSVAPRAQIGGPLRR